MTYVRPVARIARQLLAAMALALALTAVTARAVESERCIEASSLPLVPADAVIGDDAGENVRAMRRSLNEWRSYRRLLLERLEAECGGSAPALTARTDCDVAPLEDAWDDLQLSGNEVEDSMQIAAELRYVKLSATDLRSRLVLCRAPLGKAG